MRSQIAKKLLVAAMAVMFAGFGLSGNAAAASGVLSCTPGTFSLVTGSTIVLDLHEDSGSNPVNAVTLNLNYPADTVELESVDGTGSAFEVQSSNAGGGGTISIVRSSSDSVTGDQRVARLTFKGTNLGMARMSLAGGSSLMSSDTNKDVLATSVGTTMATVWVVSPRPGGNVGSTTSVGSVPAGETPVTAATPIPSSTSTPTQNTGSTQSSDTGGAGGGSGSGLPDTGAAGMVGGAMGLGTLGYGVRAWVKSRRSLRDALKRS